MSPFSRRFLALTATWIATGRWFEVRTAFGGGSTTEALPRSLLAALAGMLVAHALGKLTRGRHHDPPVSPSPGIATGLFAGAVLLPLMLSILAPSGLSPLSADILLGAGILLLVLAWERAWEGATRGMVAIWAAAAAAGVLGMLSRMPGETTAILAPLVLIAVYVAGIHAKTAPHSPPHVSGSPGWMSTSIAGGLLGGCGMALWSAGGAFWTEWVPASAHGSPLLLLAAFVSMAVGATAALALIPPGVAGRHAAVGWIAAVAGLIALAAAIPAASSLLRTAGLGVLEQLSSRFTAYQGATAPWLYAWTLAGLPFLLVGLAGGFLRATATPSRAFAPALLAGATLGAFAAPAVCFRDSARDPGFAGLPAAQSWLRREAVSSPGWMRATNLGSLVRYAGAGGKKSPREFLRWKGRWIAHREEWSSLDIAQGEWIASHLPASGRVLVLGRPSGGLAFGITSSSRDLHFTIRLLAGELDALDWPEYLRERSEIVADPPLPSPIQLLREARDTEEPWDAVVILSSPVEDGPWIDRWSLEILQGLTAAVDPKGGGVLALAEPGAMDGRAPRQLMRTWWDVFPHGRLWVLQDGYAGPVLAVASGTAAAAGAGGGAAADAPPGGGGAPDLPLLVSAPLASLAPALASAPALHLGWRSLAPRARDVTAMPRHAPSGASRESLDDLAAALEPAASPVVTALLASLAAHAGVQFHRDLILEGEWEHILVPREEIDAVLEAIRAEATHPALAHHLRALGDLLMKKREYEMVLEVFQEVLARNPRSVPAHDFVGRTLVELLEPEKALVHLQIVRANRPGDPDLLVTMGEAYAAMKQWREAVEVLEEAWARRADDATLSKMLGVCLYESGDPGRAAKLLHQAQDFAPGDPTVLKYLDKIDARRAEQRQP